jgi:hypothetical protein
MQSLTVVTVSSNSIEIVVTTRKRTPGPFLVALEAESLLAPTMKETQSQKLTSGAVLRLGATPPTMRT